MIKQRMKLYNAETKQSGFTEYGEPLSIFVFTKTIWVSISLLTKVINALDPRYLTATHIGLTADKSLIEGMKLTSATDGNYIIKIANNDCRLSQLTLEECSQTPSIPIVPIVSDGLVMNLNGADFSNSPPTTTLIDESCSGNNATPFGFGYTVTSGSDGLGGVAFDGVDDKLLTSLKFDLTTQFSISFKFKFASIYAYKQTLWAYNDSDVEVPNYNGIALTIPANSTTLTFENFNGTTSIFLTSTLVVGTTYIIDLVKRVDGSYYLYVNNVLAGSQVALSTTMDPGATFGIGYYPYTTGTDFLNETIYRVLNYTRELTDAEISQNYNASK